MPEKMVPLVGWVVLNKRLMPILQTFHLEREGAARTLSRWRRSIAVVAAAESRYPRIARIRIEEIEDAD